MDEDERVFSNNPADYNRVVCMACTAKIKVIGHVITFIWMKTIHIHSVGTSYEEAPGESQNDS